MNLTHSQLRAIIKAADRLSLDRGWTLGDQSPDDPINWAVVFGEVAKKATDELHERKRSHGSIR